MLSGIIDFEDSDEEPDQQYQQNNVLLESSPPPKILKDLNDFASSPVQLKRQRSLSPPKMPAHWDNMEEDEDDDEEEMISLPPYKQHPPESAKRAKIDKVFSDDLPIDSDQDDDDMDIRLDDAKAVENFALRLSKKLQEQGDVGTDKAHIVERDFTERVGTCVSATNSVWAYRFVII
jgi:hypothetical protein